MNQRRRKRAFPASSAAPLLIAMAVIATAAMFLTNQPAIPHPEPSVAAAEAPRPFTVTVEDVPVAVELPVIARDTPIDIDADVSPPSAGSERPAVRNPEMPTP